MASRFLLVLSASTALAAVTALAGCADELGVPPPPTNALEMADNASGSSPSGEAYSSDDDSNGESGDEGFDDGSDSESDALTANEAGSLPSDKGACSVSFENQILPKMNTAWNCASGACHGGSGATIKLTAGATKATYKTLTSTRVNGKLVADPNSHSATTSSFPCLLQGTCGDGMPFALDPSQASDLTMVQTWLACGAPYN